MGGSYAQAEKPVCTTRQTRRSPTHSRHYTEMQAQKNAGNRDLGRWCARILTGFSGPVAELAATV